MIGSRILSWISISSCNRTDSHQPMTLVLNVFCYAPEHAVHVTTRKKAQQSGLRHRETRYVLSARFAS
jgi:hypothetical protein